jgi:hypothetical protein
MTALTLLAGFLMGLVKAVCGQWPRWFAAVRNRGLHVLAWIAFIGLPLTVLQFVCLAVGAIALALLAAGFDLLCLITRRPAAQTSP